MLYRLKIGEMGQPEPPRRDYAWDSPLRKAKNRSRGIRMLLPSFTAGIKPSRTPKYMKLLPFLAILAASLTFKSVGQLSVLSMFTLFQPPLICRLANDISDGRTHHQIAVDICLDSHYAMFENVETLIKSTIIYQLFTFILGEDFMAQIPKAPSQYWHRYDKYDFVLVSTLIKALSPELQTPKLIRSIKPYRDELAILPAKDARRQQYPLLENPAIYTELINIWDNAGTYNNERLMRWLQGYGLPCVSLGDQTNTAATLSPFRAKLNDSGFSRTSDLLKRRIDVEIQLSFLLGTELVLLPTLALFAQDMHYCVRLYQALKSLDDKLVLALVHGYETIDNLNKWIAACGKNPYDDIPRESTYRLAWDRFLKHLAGHIDRIAPRPVKVQPQNPFSADLRPEYKVPDLIAAVWLNFYWDITGDGVRYATCKQCKKLFRVTRRGQQFCTAGGFTVDSPCKKKWDTQQLRARKAATAPPVPSN